MRDSTATAASQAERTLSGSPSAARHPGRGRVQPAALGDDHGHRKALHGRADRERVAEALDAVVAADDEARAERALALEVLGDAGLQIEVALARLPRVQRPLERAGGRAAEVGETPALGRLQREPQLGQVVLGVDAEGRVAIARERRGRRARAVARGLDEAVVPGEPLDLPEAQAALGEAVLGSEARALDVGRQRDGLSGRDDDPHGARGRARLDAVLEPGGQPGDGAGGRQHHRGRAQIGDPRAHEARASTTPRRRRSFRRFRTAKRRWGTVSRRYVRCQPPLFGRAERHLLQSPRCGDAG